MNALPIIDVLNGLFDVFTIRQHDYDSLFGLLGKMHFINIDQLLGIGDTGDYYATKFVKLPNC